MKYPGKLFHFKYESYAFHFPPPKKKNFSTIRNKKNSTQAKLKSTSYSVSKFLSKKIKSFHLKFNSTIASVLF